MPRRMGHFPRGTFETWAGPGGGLLTGSPQEVIDKIMVQYELFGHDRYMAQIGLGGLPFAETAKSIELLATEIMPVVQQETHPARKP
jgi:hypothetical protein